MNITIDDNTIKFKNGQTIIEAAKDSGIVIPNFCWHPGLSISGNCRICLVEVEKNPKLVIACSTLATNGMVVHTKSEKVIKAQNAVMEFLLINHPLDCPICDEAGECKLQDYAYKYGVGISRFDEEKNHKNKRVELGPNVMFDQERCISCSRCIRFCEEVAKEPQLTFVKRGENVTIETFPGKKLDNPYSMNVIEICPVGALTSRHFRFKSRVWDMSFTDSVCPGCSRGCNTIIGVRNNEILRVEPRENKDVNKWWLCDYGRLETIKNITDTKARILSPEINNQSIDWNTAYQNAFELLQKFAGDTLFVASPKSTLEDNYALLKLAKELHKDNEIIYFSNEDKNFADDILKTPDRSPNSGGLKLLKISAINDKFLKLIESKKYKLAVILNENTELEKYFDNVIQLVSFKNSVNSSVSFPLSTYAEMNGTFINCENRLQRIRPAISTVEQDRVLGEFELSRLDKFGAHNDRWTKGHKFDSKPGWKIINELSKLFSLEFSFETSEDVFDELSGNVKKLNGINYEQVGKLGYKL